MDYRTEQILNVKISQANEGGFYRLKITSMDNETKWLNITPPELDAIFRILEKERQ